MTASKESSRLLMAVIDSLSNHGSEASREKDRADLIAKFESSDHVIDIIVNDHCDSLTQTIHSYTSASAKLGASLQRVTFLKESMVKCKKLLHCQRDYLLKLWLESKEQREILKIFDKIEEVKGAPDQVNRLLAHKQYLRATELITTSVKLLETDLQSIEALRDLRCDMRQLKETLHDRLIDELHRHLYPVGARAKRIITSDKPRVRTFSFSTSRDGSPTGSPVLSQRSSVVSTVAKDHELPQKLLVDQLVNPEDDSSHFMRILVESLAILNKLPEAAERVGVRMDMEITKLVQLLIEEVAAKSEEQEEEVYFTNETETPSQPKLLLKLLRMAFDRFQLVAYVHQVFLVHLKAAMAERNVIFPLYKEDVWTSVQYVVQVLLTEYFDVKNTQGTKDASNYQSISNLSLYFDPTKKKPIRRNKVLFNFDYSTMALTSSQLGSDFPDETDGSEVKQPFKFLCKPSPDNVTVVFNELQQICSTLKDLLLIPQEEHCILSEFVEDFVRTTFLNRFREDMRNKIVAASQGVDAFKIIRASDGGPKKQGPPRPIFHGTSSLTQCFSRCKMLTKQLPSYEPTILDNVVGAFDIYRESLVKLFRDLLKLNASDIPVLSAAWTSDRSVVELFQKFDSWNTLTGSSKREKSFTPAPLASGKPGPVPFHLSHKQEETQRTKSFLADGVAPGECRLHAENIISISDTAFTTLACMHESMEWIISCYRKEKFLPSIDGHEQRTRKEVLDKVVEQMSDLHHRLLVVLHIELRFQCVYHLHSELRRTDYVCKENASIDAAIPDLNKFLCCVEETISNHLQPAKVRYVFSGLGHFLASLILDGCEHITTLNRHGIKKLCRMVFSLQQNLTNLTMSREVDLDRAQQYCELFHLHADELYRVIADGGKVFTEQQYETVLRLMILQGQSTATQSTAEYKRKLKLALAGRRVSSITH